MLADPVLRFADIQACCACFGFREGNSYKIDPDCEASLRTILRYLRNESKGCDVRLQLGQLRVISSDLIPLARCCNHDKVLFELVIRILMNLTQPALVCFRQEIPKDRDLHGAFIMVDDFLKSLKKDFADEEFFGVLCKVIGSILDKNWDERSDDDRLLIERILILVRNVLHISPDTSEEQRTDDDISVHDQVLWAMHLSGWDELLLFLGNAEDESMFIFHTLEIISLMLREQTPQNLALIGNDSSSNDELNNKRQYNRFGGAFELTNTLSLSDRPMIYHHDITKTTKSLPHKLNDSEQFDMIEDDLTIVDLSLDKRKYRKPKNRRPLTERPLHRRSILAIQLFLQKFCCHFLQHCYNPVMHAVRSNLTRHASQENDETYYLWAMKFFMSFSRCYSFRSDYLSESLSASTFHWIYDQIMHYREFILTDKRGGSTNQRALQSARRLELAISTYREFLACLKRMIFITDIDRRPSPNTPETPESIEERLKLQSAAAETIIANICYISDYHEVFPLLLREYNEALLSKDYLRDLVEGAHLYISILTNEAGNGSKKLFVKRRKIRRRKIKSSKHKTKDTKKVKDLDLELPEVRIARLEQQWKNQLSQPLIDLLHGIVSADDLPDDEDPDESLLFDATSGGSEERQLRSAVRRIQTALYAGSANLALSLARRMWRLWPQVAPISVEAAAEENESIEFARASGLAPHNLAIFGALKQIHMTELEDEEEVNQSENENYEEDDDLYNEELGDSNDEELVTSEKEVMTDVNAFLLKFAHFRVVHSYTLLLADYATNPKSTNDAIIRIMHRLAVRQRFVGCFFQLRLFHLFQTFMNDKGVSSLDEFKELRKLIKYILRKFFEAQTKNSAILIELLFFKTIKESFELVQGYGTFEDNKKTIHWTKEQDDELTQLFEAYRNDPVPRGNDLADVILNNFSDNGKTRRQIVARLIVLGLISSTKQLRDITIRSAESNVRQSKPKLFSQNKEWSDYEIDRLRTLVETHRDSKKMLTDIMNELKLDYELAVKRKQDNLELSVNEELATTHLLRPRRIVAAKILELGLVPDSSSLSYNKRKKTVQIRSQFEDNHSESNGSDVDNEDEEEEEAEWKDPFEDNASQKSLPLSKYPKTKPVISHTTFENNSSLNFDDEHSEMYDLDDVLKDSLQTDEPNVSRRPADTDLDQDLHPVSIPTKRKRIILSSSDEEENTDPNLSNIELIPDDVEKPMEIDDDSFRRNRRLRFAESDSE